tara:strand:+ start:1175 stop:1816 length:642 start_codon:yes stop_codon:yes gene_type:complete
MVTVTKIPSQEEYEETLNKINARFQKAQKDLRYHEHQAQGNQMSGCSGMHGFTGGMKSCDYWKMQSMKTFNEKTKPQKVSQMNAAKAELENYQEDVARLQTEKKQAELNAELARQQKIIEDNIRETFRIETEKMQALSDALTKERQAKIIPPPPPVIEIPKDEPLAILSHMDKLENYVQNRPQTIQESKINYSTIAIIGAIGIVSLLLVRRLM